MEEEINTLDNAMKEELNAVKKKYASLKAEVKKKYKELEKQKKRKEKEETKKLRKSIPKSLKILVWDKHIGKEKGIGECYVCKSKIDSKNFECGHIVSVKEGGATNIDNLLPICSSCNKSMGTENLMVFKKKYFNTNPDIPKKEIPTKNIQKEETKPKTPIEEFVESKVKYNDGLVDEELDNPSNRAFSHPSYGNDLPAPFPKIKTGRKVPREVKLETVYNHYRNWISVHYPQIHKDTQFEGCLGGGDNDTQENIKTIITHKYGEPINMANWSISSEMGKKITGWKNVEIID